MAFAKGSRRWASSPADTGSPQASSCRYGSRGARWRRRLVSRYLSLREQALARPEASSDALGLLAERVSDEAYQRLASLEITLAVVEIPLTGVSVPLTVTLPATLAEGATGLVDGAFAALRNIVGAPTYLERWE